MSSCQARCPRRISRRAAALLYFLLAASGATSLSVNAQTKSDPDYVEGFAAWQQAKYPVASTRLARYRVAAPYGKSYDVDYLLGTSWCRIDGMGKKGANLLSWALQHDMPESAAKLFRAEWQQCLAATAAAVAAKPALLAQTNLGPGATARASGKLFYSVDLDGSPFAAYPLELTNPLPEKEYQKRIFPLTAKEEAIAATKLRLGAGYRVIAADRFILASKTHSDAELQNVAARLVDFVGFLDREYEIKFPAVFITVQLAPSPSELVDLAMRIHGLKASVMNLATRFKTTCP